ncbi:MAG TPA: hypothetical protein VII40_18640 [Xanthobacteraceae bacterium]
MTFRSACVAAVLALTPAVSGAAEIGRFDGFNVIAAPDHPFGSAEARRALAQARRIGARAVANSNERKGCRIGLDRQMRRRIAENNS